MNTTEIGWHVGTQNDGIFIIDAPPSPVPFDGSIPVSCGPNVIAKVFDLEHAQVIASAPKMLDAHEANLADLSLMTTLFNQIDKSSLPTPFLEAFIDVRRRTKEALAQARGEI